MQEGLTVELTGEWTDTFSEGLVVRSLKMLMSCIPQSDPCTGLAPSAADK